MILWNVQIPWKAKFEIGIALCLSLFMTVIAIIRITLGMIAPGIPDTIWTYFTFSLGSSTAVFMVSATAFRSIYGHQKASKVEKSQPSNDSLLETGSRRRDGHKVKSYFSSPQPVEWHDKDLVHTKRIYHDDIDQWRERSEASV